MLLPNRPAEAPTEANGGHRQPADIVPGQLEGALAPNTSLGIPSAGSGQA